MPEKQVELRDVVDAINDLARINIAVSGKFESRNDAVRALLDLSIPPARVAAILAMPPKQVWSVIAKAKRSTKSKEQSAESRYDVEGGDAEKAG